MQHSRDPSYSNKKTNHILGRLIPQTPTKGKKSKVRGPATPPSGFFFSDRGDKEANGIPSWEHPGALEDLKSSRPVDRDASPRSPRRRILCNQVLVPPSPASTKASPKKQGRRRPNFENLVIVLDRQDSDQSLGELTYDGSVAFDMEYQSKKSKPPKEVTTSPSTRSKQEKKSKKKRKSKPEKKTKGKAKAPKCKQDEQLSGSPRLNHSFETLTTAEQTDVDSIDTDKVSSPQRRKGGKKAEALEACSSPLGLSEIYECWKDSSVASCQGLEKDDAKFIFDDNSISMNGSVASSRAGDSVSSRSQLEIDQETVLVEMALQRSLQDFSSQGSLASSLGASDSTLSCSLGTSVRCCATGPSSRKHHSPSRTVDPSDAYGLSPQKRHRQRPALQQKLSWAGCHLAMLGNKEHNRSAVAGSSILSAYDHSSNHEEEDEAILNYEQPKFLWKRDARTKRWYKKPILSSDVCEDEEQSILEEATRQSVKEALATSFDELKLQNMADSPPRA